MNDANFHFGIFVQCIIYLIFQRQYSFPRLKGRLDHLPKAYQILTPSLLIFLTVFLQSCLVLILQKINVAHLVNCKACYRQRCIHKFGSFVCVYRFKIQLIFTTFDVIFVAYLVKLNSVEHLLSTKSFENFHFREEMST